MHGIVHKDLKPENILLSKNFTEGKLDVRIADFGLAIYEEAPTSEHLSGTPCFMAPEAIAKKHLTTKADIFSIGCIIFKMLMRKNLFQGSSQEHSLKLNKKADLTEMKSAFTKRKDLSV